MRKAVLVKTYAQLPGYDRCEILRYAGVRGEDDGQMQTLLDECLAECDGVFQYRVCHIAMTRVEFFEIFPQGKTAQSWTENCENVVVFVATIGLGIDRLINRYASVSTTKALLFQAIGAERIESLCDAFCKEFDGAGRRFSPGYGDFPLTEQTKFFALLNPSKHIGVSLTDSLLMSPTKSVTAVFGIKNSACERENEEKRCHDCDKSDCVFRKD